MMSRFILLALATLAMLFESQICLAASDMGEVGLLQNIFKCYSASNWYGECEMNYATLVKRWSSQLPAPLQPAVYREQRECNGGVRHLFLFPRMFCGDTPLKNARGLGLYRQRCLKIRDERSCLIGFW